MKEASLWNAAIVHARKPDVFLDGGVLDTRSARTSIHTALSPLTRDGQPFHLPEFQHEVSEALVGAVPEIHAIADMTRDKVQHNLRFAVVRGLGFSQHPDEIRDLYILGFSTLMGDPTTTDKVNKKVLWPVKAEVNPTVQNLTFSQRLGEAAYHTDTQYFERPEDMFGLWCVKPDRNQNGVSGLVDGRYVVDELLSTEEGANVVDVFRSTEFPFMVPSAFTTDGSDASIEVFRAPILSAVPLIRYRRETMDQGARATGEPLSDAQLRAVNYFDRYLLTDGLAFNYLIGEGEVLFTNNHELLHSRSNFDDPNRHLIRVRMNSRPTQQPT